MAVDGGDALEGGPSSLSAGTGLALDLVADPEAVLPDDPLADVHIAAGGKVSRLTAPEEARAPPGDLENAEHQVPATERLMRCRMAVSPWVLVIPRVSLRPSWSRRSSGTLATSSGGAPSSERASSETNPRTVGDSRGTSAWMCTRPSSTSTQRNTGVWHSCTRWLPAAFSRSSRSGSGGSLRE